MSYLIAALLFGAGTCLTVGAVVALGAAGGRLARVLIQHEPAAPRPPSVARPAGPLARLEAEAREAGLAIDRRHLAAVALGAPILAGLSAYLFTGAAWLAACAAAAGLLAPRAWLRVRRRQQQDAYHAQLDGALLSLANYLRAGQTLTQGLHALAEHVKPPLGREFQRAAQATRLNLTAADALALVGERIALPEYTELESAVRLHAEMGGNLAGTLERIAEQVRERRRVRAAIRAATSGSRAEAVIVQATTVGMALSIPVVAPSLLDQLLREPLGKLMATAAALLTVVAWILIARCLEVPYE